MIVRRRRRRRCPRHRRRRRRRRRRCLRSGHCLLFILTHFFPKHFRIPFVSQNRSDNLTNQTQTCPCPFLVRLC